MLFQHHRLASQILLLDLIHPGRRGEQKKLVFFSFPIREIKLEIKWKVM
jgi:hypothetical protein